MEGEQPASPGEDTLKAIVESLLFVSAEPLAMAQLCQIIEGASKEEIRAALDEIQEECRDPGRGIQCVELAGGFTFTTRAVCAHWVKRLVSVRPRLSKSALEVLAIIAYKQPITRPEIEEVRGMDAGGVVRTLLDRRLVKILGRKEGVGRPVIYGTTKEFLKAFGLNDLKDLPPLKELPGPDLFDGDSGGPDRRLEPTLQLAAHAEPAVQLSDAAEEPIETTGDREAVRYGIRL